jgi:hypothetical protein
MSRVQIPDELLPVLAENQEICSDLDEDCLQMTHDQILVCALHAPENGYCPFHD